MVPCLFVGEVGVARHHLFHASVAQHPVLLLVDVEAQAVAVVAACLEDGLFATGFSACRVYPHLNGIAVALACIDAADVSLHALLVVQPEGIVLVVQQPGVVDHEVVGVACVGGHVAVAFLHGPVVGQAVDIVVLRLVLSGGSLSDVAVDVEQCQVVYGTVHIAKIEVVVVAVVYLLHHHVVHRLVGEELERGVAMQCQGAELLL